MHIPRTQYMPKLRLAPGHCRAWLLQVHTKETDYDQPGTVLRCMAKRKLQKVCAAASDQQQLTGWSVAEAKNLSGLWCMQ